MKQWIASNRLVSLIDALAWIGQADRPLKWSSPFAGVATVNAMVFNRREPTPAPIVGAVPDASNKRLATCAQPGEAIVDDARLLVESAGLTNETANMSDGEFSLFRDWVLSHCEIELGSSKKNLLETRLARLLVECHCATFRSFYDLLNKPDSANLRDRVVDAVTTHETSWFRDENAWLALRDEILPDLLKRSASTGSRLRIWSAACSTGQEPYSLAMLIDDLCRRHPEWQLDPRGVEIVATDISIPALVVAAAGRYDSISMRRGLVGQWERLRSQYFAQQGQVSVLSPEIRGRVSYQCRNLRDSLGQVGSFDLVLLRYVAIYFSSRFKEQLWARLRSCLRPAGRLVLGAAETIPDAVPGFVRERHGRLYSFRISNEGNWNG